MRQPKTQALVGLILGALALVLITAILTSAVASSSADTRTEALATKLEKVTNDLTALRDDSDEQQVGNLEARADLQHDNDVLKYQNRVLQQKVLTLIRILRASNINVPPATIPPTPSPQLAPSPRVDPPDQPGDSDTHRAKPKKP